MPRNAKAFKASSDVHTVRLTITSGSSKTWMSVALPVSDCSLHTKPGAPSPAEFTIRRPSTKTAVCGSSIAWRKVAMLSWARCGSMVDSAGRRCGPGGGASLPPLMSSHLDDDVGADRQAERQDERLGMIVLERRAADAAEQRGVRRPDHRCQRDPAHEPRSILSGDATRQRQHRASAGDEACGDQQQTAAPHDLTLRPRQFACELRLALGASLEPVAGAEPDEVGGVVTEE